MNKIELQNEIAKLDACETQTRTPSVDSFRFGIVICASEASESESLYLSISYNLRSIF